MKRSTMTTGKRWVSVLTAAGLTLALLAGCGKSDDAAKPADSSQQTGGNQASNSDDPLAQFPPLKLPFTVKPDEAIVQYKGGELTGKEFEEFLKAVNFFNPPQGQAVEHANQDTIKTFAREVAATEILASRADAKTHAASQAKAADTFGKLKQQYVTLLGNDEAKFQKLLETQGITQDEVVAELTMINDSIAALSKEITDSDLDKLYKADPNAYTIASVRHILIGTEKRKPEEALKLAQEISARLKKGEDFAKLAKQYSDDPGSKDNGGLYENADVTQWVAPFQKAALTLPIGQISDPVKTDYGYHVMKVEKRGKNVDKLRNKALEDRYDAFSKNELDKLITKWNLPEVKPAAQ